MHHHVSINVCFFHPSPIANLSLIVTYVLYRSFSRPQHLLGEAHAISPGPRGRRPHDVSNISDQSIKRGPWDKAGYTVMQICKLRSGFYTLLLKQQETLKSFKQASTKY